MRSDRQTEFSQPLAQVTQELAADLVRDAQMTVHQAVEVVAEEDEQPAVRVGPCLGRADGIAEQAQFAEEFAGAEPGQLAVFRASLAAYRHLAFEQEVDRLTDLALVENHFAGQVVALVEQVADNGKLGRRQIREKRQAPQVFEIGRRGAEKREFESHGINPNPLWMTASLKA